MLTQINLILDTYRSSQTFVLESSELSLRQLALWNLVRKAQTSALLQARNGTLTADVDRVARHVLDEAGFGKYFTHRLGHGK